MDRNKSNRHSNKRKWGKKKRKEKKRKNRRKKSQLKMWEGRIKWDEHEEGRQKKGILIERTDKG